METTTPNPSPASEKKPIFETVVISTPVLLTVVATFILGRSSSEMTQAQYHRATAGQNQSKVADQWAFFQAKRIRGTNYETTAIGLAAQNAEPFASETLREAAQSLVSEIQAGMQETKSRDEKLKSLESKADAALEQVSAALVPGADGWQGKRTLLTVANVKPAMDALEAYPAAPPADAEDKLDAGQRKILDEVLDDIRKFKPEKETSPKTLALAPETIDAAMEKAKANAARLAERSKAIDRVLEEFDALVERQVALAREYQRVLGSQISALARANGDAAEIDRAQKRFERVRNLSSKLLVDYKAARYAFDAKRYEEDARANQEAAYLYDVQVLQSSARADRHLKRSFGFMIAMLIAQVGVTIASLAMAMKQKIPVWAIAAMSGVLAILFGVYVFLEIGPL